MFFHSISSFDTVLLFLVQVGKLPKRMDFVKYRGLRAFCLEFPEKTLSKASADFVQFMNERIQVILDSSDYDQWLTGVVHQICEHLLIEPVEIVSNEIPLWVIETIPISFYCQHS